MLGGSDMFFFCKGLNVLMATIMSSSSAPFQWLSIHYKYKRKRTLPCSLKIILAIQKEMYFLWSRRKCFIVTKV